MQGMEEAKFDAAKEVSGDLEASAALPGQNPGILAARYSRRPWASPSRFQTSRGPDNALPGPALTRWTQAELTRPFPQKPPEKGKGIVKKPSHCPYNSIIRKRPVSGTIAHCCQNQKT